MVFGRLGSDRLSIFQFVLAAGDYRHVTGTRTGCRGRSRKWEWGLAWRAITDPNLPVVAPGPFRSKVVGRVPGVNAIRIASDEPSLAASGCPGRGSLGHDRLVGKPFRQAFALAQPRATPAPWRMRWISALRSRSFAREQDNTKTPPRVRQAGAAWLREAAE
jgi:hypothetical protein